MKLFKKKADNLIKESVKTVKEEFGRSLEPWAIFAVVVAAAAFIYPPRNNSQPVIINIYTNKEKNICLKD